MNGKYQLFGAFAIPSWAKAPKLFLNESLLKDKECIKGYNLYFPIILAIYGYVF